MSIFEMLLANAMGESGGGGGSSDFSTAEVQIGNTSGAPVSCGIPIVEDMYDDSTAITTINRDDVNTYKVILYKGKSYIFIDSENIALTGDISTEDGFLLVTGDGTITIS